MKKFVLALSVVGLLIPAAAFAAAPQDASTFCKTNASTLIGTGKLYSTMGACVRAQNAQQAQNTTNASAACKAEMASTTFAADHGGKTFAQFYGTGRNATNGNATNGNGNALGKCVSTKASAKNAAQQSATVKAAKACKTDATLKAKIADHTYKNYGACVSAQVKKQLT